MHFRGAAAKQIEHRSADERSVWRAVDHNYRMALRDHTWMPSNTSLAVTRASGTTTGRWDYVVDMHSDIDHDGLPPVSHLMNMKAGYLLLGYCPAIADHNIPEANTISV